MAQYKYATKMENEDSIARAVGRDVEISKKQAIEVCNFIKGMNVDDAKKILQDVINKKKAVKFRRFTGGAAHRKGIGAGKYPIKCCIEILRLLNQVAANASFKGLNPSNMIIKALCPQTGAKRWHYGRQRRRRMKRANLEIVIQESEEKKTSKKQKDSEGKKAAEKNITKKKEAKEEMKK